MSIFAVQHHRGASAIAALSTRVSGVSAIALIPG
jgi:hypothetical protein